MMRRQPNMFGHRSVFSLLCLLGLLWVGYAEGHSIHMHEAPVTDFNGDGKTDFPDFIAFIAAFGTQQAPFDLDQNGQVDFPDVLVFAAAFGQPEPGTSEFVASELLGRPTDKSVTVNVVTSADLEIYLEYGIESGVYTDQTSVVTGTAGTPIEIVTDGLRPNTQYYYRMRYRRTGDTDFRTREEYTFHTHRPPGTTFTFAIQSDAHLDGRSSLELYHRSLENIAAYRPDFLIDLGDTFMCNKHSDPLSETVQPARDYSMVVNRYLYERENFGRIAHSVPLFLVNGNHDGEEGWSLDGTSENLPIWATRARKLYYLNPDPDAFYSGGSTPEPFVGLRESYYSWTWGDALFVVLDPYWYTKAKPRRGGRVDNWQWTLGEGQYRWLKEVLETSGVTFKFVFAHHMTGGIHTGQGRGGIEVAPYYEWGGKNADGSWGFDRHRPGWEKPIHQLMVDTGVTIFFTGTITAL